MVENLGFQHSGEPQPVLQNIHFKIEPGERVVLLGSNGSGKTTLVRLLNGVLRPTSGSIQMQGQMRDLDTRVEGDLQEIRRRIGLLFQDPDNQFVSTTAEREIAFGLENLRKPSREIIRMVDEALDFFDMKEYRHQPPHEMSGGEKARLALACVWVMNPSLLIMDETKSLLDYRSSQRLDNKISALENNMALLQVTTHAEEAAGATRLLVLHRGSLVADGPPDDVFGALPKEILDLVGAPLIWRLTQRLVEKSVLNQPTCSWEQLENKCVTDRRLS